MGQKIRAVAARWFGLLVAVLRAEIVSGQQSANLPSATNQMDRPSSQASLTNELDLSSLTNEFKLRLWNTTLSLRGTLGYSDNVGLAATNRQGSAFWDTGVDAMSIRLPTEGWMFSLFASGDDRRYFAGATGQNEQVVLAGAQANRSLPDNWSAGAGLNYFFQNQIVDVNATATNQAPISQVTGHNFSGRLFARKEFKSFWAQLEVSGGREIFSAPLDSLWQLGPRLNLGHRFSERSEITFNYQWSYLWYDTRQQVSSSGYALPGTSLRCASQSADLTWHQAWNATTNGWHSYLGAVYDLNQDNGTGYFSSSQYLFFAKIEHRAATWSVAGSLRGGFYDFPVQTVSVGSSERRTKSGFSAALHADKQLSKRLKLFADYTYDRSSSDLATDNYYRDVVSIGFAWQFW